MKTAKTKHGYKVIGTNHTVREQPKTSSLSCGWEVGIVTYDLFYPTHWVYDKKSALLYIESLQQPTK